MIASYSAFTETIFRLPACHSFQRFHAVAITVGIRISAIHSSIYSLKVFGHDGHLCDLLFGHYATVSLNESRTCYTTVYQTFVQIVVITGFIGLNDKVIKVRAYIGSVLYTLRFAVNDQ